MQDPQDRGPGYRNVVGIPGGFNSELFKVFESKNKNGMKLVPGEGAEFRNGRATETDAINTVFVVDSNALPFHQAEMCVPYPGAALPHRQCQCTYTWSGHEYAGAPGTIALLQALEQQRCTVEIVKL